MEKQASEAKPQKSKRGLFVALAGLIIIAIGVITTVLVVNAQNSPENITLDAITKTMKSSSHTLTGKMEISASTASTMDSNVNYTGSVILELEGANTGMANAASVTVTIKTGASSDFVFRFDEVFSEDGTLYLRGSDLTSFVSSAISAFGDYLKTEPLASIASSIKSLASKIGSKWWRISVSDLTKMFDVENQGVLDQYNCVIEAAKNLYSDSNLNVLADIYQNHQFINARKYDGTIASFTGTAYEASVDTGKLAQFWNAYIVSAPMKQISSCTAGDGATLKETSEEQLSSLGDKKVYLDIDGSHNLLGFYLSGSENGSTYTADMRLKDSAEAITVPSDTRSIAELKDDIVKVVSAIASLFTASTVEVVN